MICRSIFNLLKGRAPETRMGKMRQWKRITPHLLRHSSSSWALDAGIDISVSATSVRPFLVDERRFTCRQAQSSEEVL
jgi:integrase